jgi:hypothetical protein
MLSDVQDWLDNPGNWLDYVGDRDHSLEQAFRQPDLGHRIAASAAHGHFTPAVVMAHAVCPPARLHDRERS